MGTRVSALVVVRHVANEDDDEDDDMVLVRAPTAATVRVPEPRALWQCRRRPNRRGGA